MSKIETKKSFFFENFQRRAKREGGGLAKWGGGICRKDQLAKNGAFNPN